MNVKSEKLLKIVFLVIYILLVSLFFYFALQTSLESSNESGKISRVIVWSLRQITGKKYLINIQKVEYLTRKIVGHFLFCALIGINLISFLALSFSSKCDRIKYIAILSVILSIFVSITGELLQILSAGRSCEFLDMIINFSGHIFGMIFIFCFILKKRKNYD